MSSCGIETCKILNYMYYCEAYVLPCTLRESHQYFQQFIRGRLNAMIYTNALTTRSRLYRPAALLVDPENSLDNSREFAGDFLAALPHLLCILRVEAWYLGYDSIIRRCYIEQQWWHSEKWQRRCQHVAHLCGFDVVWSPPRLPAETCLAYDARTLHDTHELPDNVVIASGDGDLSLLTLRLQSRGHNVHFMCSSLHRLNFFLHRAASGCSIYHIPPIVLNDFSHVFRA